MAHVYDFSKDLEVIYGLDTFTLKVEGAADVTLDDCVLTEPISTHEHEPTDGQVIQMDQLMVWPIYKSPTKPPLGSCLVDSDGDYWIILSVLLKQHVDTWEARCRNISIIPSVANRVVVLRASYHKGAANEACADWSGYVSGEDPPTNADVIHSKLQPAMEIAQIRYGAEWARQTYRLLLEEKLDIDMAGGEYRVQSPSGDRFRILELFNEARLDRLPVAMVVRIIEGQEYYGYGSPGPPPTPVFPAP